ncbi:hypothetical protein TGGT1_220480 [Toxoplasma gondii GT1]|uniref:Uncharacterized protein n=5 Tax=Toxoplasma gondii TaxID=5811 RepID=S7UH17_TOXGG|nr:hypothetical protein TGGT1_220480 [Toxoplasma gondii GT1]KAF4643626.1 hypothetical protein TGRH88_023800 [Toxoplasma gondii]KFG35403.1 hypothetical protein TGFOU_220480 [Toxoplasma gondii FOU]PUA83949.1 hypothetical protein TGBR9_220480 [Toxoplasma gondii TgCATBr9]RQX66978.1 hypothetical protein TGCAST_220480 [Toxoplasma gondii CAST]
MYPRVSFRACRAQAGAIVTTTPHAAAEIYAAPSEEAVERIVHATASQLLLCFSSSSSSSLFPSSPPLASSEPAECFRDSACRLSARAVGVAGAAGEPTERATEASERGAPLAGGGRSIFFDASAREFFSDEDQLCILLGYHHAASLRPILDSLSPFLFRLLLFSGPHEPLLPAGHPSACSRSALSLSPWVVELCRQPGTLQRVLQGLSRDEHVDQARSLLEEETRLLDMLASALSTAELHQSQAPRRAPVSEAPARPRRQRQFPGDTSGGCAEAGRTRERSRASEGDIEEQATGRGPCERRTSEASGSYTRVEKGEVASLSALDQVAWRLLDHCCERFLLLERGQGGQGRSHRQSSCLPLLSTAGMRILLHLVRAAEARPLRVRVRNEEPVEDDLVDELNRVPTQRRTDSDRGHLRGDCVSVSSSPGNPVASVEGRQRSSDVRGVAKRGEEKPREQSFREAPAEMWTVASLCRLRQTASRLQRMLLRSPLSEFSHADALVALPAAAVFLDQVQDSVASLLQRAQSAEGGTLQGETASEQQVEPEAAECRRGLTQSGDSLSGAAAPSWGEGEPRSEDLGEQTKERRALGRALKARVFQEVDRREAEATLLADDVVDCLNAIVRVRSARLSTVALLLRTLCNRTDDFSPEQREDLSVGLRLLHASLQRQSPCPRARPRGSSAPSSLVRLQSREVRIREEGAQRQNGGGGEMQDRGKRAETTHKASKLVLSGQQEDSQEIVFFSCRDARNMRAQVSGAEWGNGSGIEVRAGDAATEREDDYKQVIAFLERIQEHKILERKHRSLISWSNRRW